MEYAQAGVPVHGCSPPAGDVMVPSSPLLRAGVKDFPDIYSVRTIRE